MEEFLKWIACNALELDVVKHKAKLYEQASAELVDLQQSTKEKTRESTAKLEQNGRQDNERKQTQKEIVTENLSQDNRKSLSVGAHTSKGSQRKTFVKSFKETPTYISPLSTFSEQELSQDEEANTAESERKNSHLVSRKRSLYSRRKGIHHRKPNSLTIQVQQGNQEQRTSLVGLSKEMDKSKQATVTQPQPTIAVAQDLPLKIEVASEQTSEPNNVEKNCKTLPKKDISPRNATTNPALTPISPVESLDSKEFQVDQQINMNVAKADNPTLQIETRREEMATKLENVLKKNRNRTLSDN